MNTPLNGSTQELHNPLKVYLVQHGAFTRLTRALFVYWLLIPRPFIDVCDPMEGTFLSVVASSGNQMRL